MLEEFKKSVSSILYQRATSPFYGALAASWIAWNWQFLYFTIFVSSEKLEMTKLDFVRQNLSTDILNFLIYPLIGAFIIILIVPFFSNGAYWISLKFQNWQKSQRIILENKIPLTIEESIKLREAILQQGDRFKSLTLDKENKILELQEQIKNLRDTLVEKQILLKKKESKLTSHIAEIHKIEEKNNFTDPFKGEWFYKLSDEKNMIFNIWNENELEFKNHKYKFKIHTIYRHRNNDFKLLLYPKTTGSNIDFEIKFIEIHRSENGEEYKGFEISSIWDGEKYKGSYKDLKIYKA